MSRAARRRNDHLQAPRLRTPAIIDDEIRCAMRTDRSTFVRDAELFESLCAVLHHVPIRRAAHDNSNDRCGHESKTEKPTRACKAPSVAQHTPPFGHPSQEGTSVGRRYKIPS